MTKMSWCEKRRWRRAFEEGIDAGLATHEATTRADNIIRAYRIRDVRP